MKSGFFLIAAALLLSPLAACGQARTQEWNYSNLQNTPENWGGLKISVNKEVKTPDGQPSLELVPEYSTEDLEWPSHLRYPARAALAIGAKSVEVTFWFKGDVGSQIAMRVTAANAGHYTATRYYELTGEWQKIEFKEALTGQVSGKWLSAPRLLLSKAKGGQHYFIGPVAFKAVE